MCTASCDRGSKVNSMELRINTELFERFGVQLAYLFGSSADPTQTKCKDTDIAVLFEDNLTPTQAEARSLELYPELAASLPTELDLITLNAASPVFKYEIVCHGKPIYCKEENIRIEYEVAVLREYFDIQPMRDMMFAEFEKRLMQGVQQ